jgi:hypothetical protein
MARQLVGISCHAVEINETAIQLPALVLSVSNQTKMDRVDRGNVSATLEDLRDH